jgi:YidC/Oxa1 family membrane protein insertase
MQMSDQSRMLLAASLMMAVLVLSWFLASPRSASAPPQAPAEDVSAFSAEDFTATTDESATQNDQPDLYTEVTATGQETREIVVQIMDEGSLMVDASISTRGGAVTRWSLMRFPDLAGESRDNQVNLAAEPWLEARGRDGERIAFVSDCADTVTVTEETVITFLSGSATRTYTFRPGSYSFDVTEENMSGRVTVQSGAIPVTEVNTDLRQYYSAYWHTNKMNRKKAPSLDELTATGNSRWVAAASRYFCIILLPQNRERVNGFVSPGEGGSPEISLETGRVTVYAGPVSYTLLSSLGSDTANMVDFGFPVIRQLAQLIFLYLDRVLSFIGNWGLRIIILAITLKLIMMPLTKKSFVAMQKMQRLSPAIKEIQKKHAGDPQKQQQAMQKLYKDAGANPLGGCLPMILQMPVFFAMYRVLGNAVELRGAPFILWITDLSRPELILSFGAPILGLEGIGLMALITGAFMIVQQSMSSAAMQQQKGMMYLMPVFMSYIFMKFAAGLNLYWMIYNLLTMAHQEIIKKKLEAADSR